MALVVLLKLCRADRARQIILSKAKKYFERQHRKKKNGVLHRHRLPPTPQSTVPPNLSTRVSDGGVPRLLRVLDAEVVRHPPRVPELPALHPSPLPPSPYVLHYALLSSPPLLPEEVPVLLLLLN